jgi:CHAD domain-containing protein
MAFRLRPDESVTHGLRRLARKELERARGELRKTNPPRDEAIHEARKSVKKVRAILQLIEDDEGNGVGGSGKRLHSVNRTLSGLRDADVMIETFARLRTRHPRLFSEHTFARVHHDLAARKRDVTRTAGRNGDWTSVDRKLQTARRSAKRWKPTHKSSGALTRGIRAAHRRGRKAMMRAREQQQASDFHAWRKEIKALWYALRLIEHSDPGLRRDIRALNRGETLLGDEHNLVVLCEQLSRDSSVCRGPVDIDRLRLMADRDQCRLRKQALERVRQIYERGSGAYARAVVRAWKASRSQAKNGQGRRKHGPAA